MIFSFARSSFSYRLIKGTYQIWPAKKCLTSLAIISSNSFECKKSTTLSFSEVNSKLQIFWASVLTTDLTTFFRHINITNIIEHLTASPRCWLILYFCCYTSIITYKASFIHLVHENIPLISRDSWIVQTHCSNLNT